MKNILNYLTFASFILILTILGSIYTYSVYRPFIIDYYDISFFISGLPYMTSLAFFAISMYYFGRKIIAQNIKKLLVLSSIFLSSGFLLSAYAPNIWLFTLGYGSLVGVGVGIVYAIGLNIVPRLFTARIGLLSGIVLMGFGLSSSLISPIAQVFLSQFSLQAWFLVFALASLIFSNLPSLFFSLTHETKEQQLETTNLTLFIVFFTIASFIGLMIIGISGFIGTNVYQFDGGSVALLVSLFALGNAGARPVFGWLMDRFDFIQSVYMINSLVIIASLINLLNQGRVFVLFGVGYFIYWVSLGAWLSMMPLLIKRIVGTKQYAAAYGKVFLGYGIAAILGTLLSGAVLDVLGGPLWIYLGIILLIVGLTVFSMYIQRRYIDQVAPKKKITIS